MVAEAEGAGNSVAGETATNTRDLIRPGPGLIRASASLASRDFVEREVLALAFRIVSPFLGNP